MDWNIFNNTLQHTNFNKLRAVLLFTTPSDAYYLYNRDNEFEFLLTNAVSMWVSFMIFVIHDMHIEEH